jgi:CCR4-NOT transcription complex subunit 3
LISSTPSKNYQPSAAQILAQNNSNNNIQSPSTIPTAPIAFSAVAKQNPGKKSRESFTSAIACLLFHLSPLATLENGPISMIVSGQSNAPAPAPTLSNNNMVSSVSSESSANLTFFNPCRRAKSSFFLADLQSQHQSTVHNNNNSSNAMSNNVENHMNNNSSLSNCVSPTSNQSAVVSGRTSPSSLMSPQQQQQQQQALNGPSNQKQLQQISSGALSQNIAVADPSSESMSLKTIAQEVVNRTNVNQVQTPPVNISQQQQQQQNQSYVMDTSIDSSTATGQNGLNANINNLINATNMSNTNMKSSGTNEALIPPLLGVAPLGPSPLQKDHQVQVSAREKCSSFSSFSLSLSF